MTAAGDGSTECAALRGSGDTHFAASHVGVNLHEASGFSLRFPPEQTIRFDGNAIVAEAFDDHACTESSGRDECAVDLGSRGVEGLADEQPGQPLVDENRAVAIVPVERHEAGLTGEEAFCFFRHFSMMRGSAVADPLPPTI